MAYKQPKWKKVVWIILALVVGGSMVLWTIAPLFM